MGFVIVTQFNSTTGAVEKSFRGFASLGEAQARVDALPEPWLSAAVVLEEPSDGDPARWFVDDTAAPTALAYIAKPTPTNAEIAANISLTRAQFAIAIEQTMGLSGNDALPFAWLATQIDDATHVSMTPEVKRVAKLFLVEAATQFERQDENGLIELIGTVVLGLTTDEIDQMFISSSQLLV